MFCIRKDYLSENIADAWVMYKKPESIRRVDWTAQGVVVNGYQWGNDMIVEYHWKG